MTQRIACGRSGNLAKDKAEYATAGGAAPGGLPTVTSLEFRQRLHTTDKSKPFFACQENKHQYMGNEREITISVEAGDALEFQADVIALKYAQSFYGVDGAVARLLETQYSNLHSLLPKIGGFRLLASQGLINCTNVLFVGVNPLRRFGYREIRMFGRKVLDALAGAAPEVEHLALTIHGPGYGLDETEAFVSELAGLLDAIKSGDFPERLQRITIIERNVARAKRLQAHLSKLLPNNVVQVGEAGEMTQFEAETSEELESAGYSSEEKRHVFVAMPFADEMDDIFHYGIQNAVNAAGYLCERADLSAFTGDVMDWVKKRIASSSLVIADLSTANPNVYLEVGFAWGCGTPTVLLCRDTADLKFDVKTQRCLIYKRIKDLEEALRNELKGLSAGPKSA